GWEGARPLPGSLPRERPPPVQRRPTGAFVRRVPACGTSRSSWPCMDVDGRRPTLPSGRRERRSTALRALPGRGCFTDEVCSAWLGRSLQRSRLVVQCERLQPGFLLGLPPKADLFFV